MFFYVTLGGGFFQSRFGANSDWVRRARRAGGPSRAFQAGGPGRAGRAGGALKRDSCILCEEGLKRDRNSLLDCEEVLGLSVSPECREWFPE